MSDILTLVTSPSSVPFVSSSPLKSKPRTTGAVINEISLKCDEKLSEVKVGHFDVDIEILICYKNLFSFVLCNIYMH